MLKPKPCCRLSPCIPRSTAHVTGLQEALTPAIALSSRATSSIARGENRRGQPGRNNKWCRSPWPRKTEQRQQAASAALKLRGRDRSGCKAEQIPPAVTLALPSASGDAQEGENQTLKRRDLEGAGLSLDDSNHPAGGQLPFRGRHFPNVSW